MRLNAGDKERRRTSARVVDDYGPDGFWGRKEAGKKVWCQNRGDLCADGKAPTRRMRRKYDRIIQNLIEDGETP